MLDMLDSLPTWTAHLEHQDCAGPSWSSIALKWAQLALSWVQDLSDSLLGMLGTQLAANHSKCHTTTQGTTMHTPDRSMINS
jgi:hypothetical protein